MIGKLNPLCNCFLSVLLVFYYCHKHQKQPREKRVYLFHFTVHLEGRSGQELKGRIGAETMEECYLGLALHCLLSLLSHISQDHRPRGGTAQGWHCP